MSKCLLAGAITALAVFARASDAAILEDPLSIGTPNRGQLVGGKLFRATPYMITIPVRAKSPVRWGLPALLSVLDRASRVVARKFPGSVLEIGELSKREGGPAASHLSHQNGRDADVGFYVTNLYGEPERLQAFTRFDGSGEGKDDPWLRFDDARNWTFVRAILEDPETEVRQIFIYAPLRARLLAYAASVRAPRAIRAKAAAAMMQPMNALPHDDHFHIRISCPVDQLERGCSDLPMWRGMGSPDEFAPAWLARWSSSWQLDTLNALPPEGWGSIARLWSAERSICRRADLSCGSEDDQPMTEDDFDPSLLDIAFPPSRASFATRGSESQSPEIGQLELSLWQAGVFGDRLSAWPRVACIPDSEETRTPYAWGPRRPSDYGRMLPAQFFADARGGLCSRGWVSMPFVWRMTEPTPRTGSPGPEEDQLAAD